VCLFVAFLTDYSIVGALALMFCFLGKGGDSVTFTCCWNHLEAAVVTETSQMKAESERSKQQGGTEMVGGTITIQPYTSGQCQVCGKPSLFSVYYQVQYRVEIGKKEKEVKPT